MPKKKPAKSLPPPDTASREWFAIYFRRGIVYRNVQLVANGSTEQQLPPHCRPENGATLTRCDTGERIKEPIYYVHTVLPKLLYVDDFAGVMYAEIRCDFSPGRKPEPDEPKKASNEKQATVAAPVTATTPRRKKKKGGVNTGRLFE